MSKCGICESELLNNSLTIEGVPDGTFNITNEKIGLHLYECSVCGAVQLGDVELSDKYWESHKSIGVSSGYREAKKRKLENFLNLGKERKYAEVGCGKGEYLEILKELGVHAKGYPDIDSVPWEPTYGCTFLFYYLEHMPYPKSFMEIIYDMTLPNGLVYIEVPNYDYIVSIGTWLEFTKDHRYYFGKRSMTYLLSSCGFEIESVDNETDDCLTVVARKPKNCGGTLDYMKERMEHDIKRFNEVTKSFGKYNVYGAGHHALMMLSQAEVKPQRIFDSNPAKVGNTLNGVIIEHGSHVQTVSMFEPIIIMCGGYNAEIKQKLEGKNIMEWR